MRQSSSPPKKEVEVEAVSVPPPSKKPPLTEDWEGYNKKEADRFGVVENEKE